MDRKDVRMLNSLLKYLLGEDINTVAREVVASGILGESIHFTDDDLRNRTAVELLTKYGLEVAGVFIGDDPLDITVENPGELEFEQSLGEFPVLDIEASGYGQRTFAMHLEKGGVLSSLSRKSPRAMVKAISEHYVQRGTGGRRVILALRDIVAAYIRGTSNSDDAVAKDALATLYDTRGATADALYHEAKKLISAERNDGGGLIDALSGAARGYAKALKGPKRSSAGGRAADLVKGILPEAVVAAIAQFSLEPVYGFVRRRNEKTAEENRDGISPERAVAAGVAEEGAKRRAKMPATAGPESAALKGKVPVEWMKDLLLGNAFSGLARVFGNYDGDGAEGRAEKDSRLLKARERVRNYLPSMDAKRIGEILFERPFVYLKNILGRSDSDGSDGAGERGKLFRRYMEAVDARNVDEFFERSGDFIRGMPARLSGLYEQLSSPKHADGGRADESPKTRSGTRFLPAALAFGGLALGAYYLSNLPSDRIAGQSANSGKTAAVERANAVKKAVPVHAAESKSPPKSLPDRYALPGAVPEGVRNWRLVKGGGMEIRVGPADNSYIEKEPGNEGSYVIKTRISTQKDAKGHWATLRLPVDKGGNITHYGVGVAHTTTKGQIRRDWHYGEAKNGYAEVRIRLTPAEAESLEKGGEIPLQAVGIRHEGDTPFYRRLASYKNWMAVGRDAKVHEADGQKPSAGRYMGSSLDDDRASIEGESGMLGLEKSGVFQKYLANRRWSSDFAIGKPFMEAGQNYLDKVALPLLRRYNAGTTNLRTLTRSCDYACISSPQDVAAALADAASFGGAKIRLSRYSSEIINAVRAVVANSVG